MPLGGRTGGQADGHAHWRTVGRGRRKRTGSWTYGQGLSGWRILKTMIFWCKWSAEDSVAFVLSGVMEKNRSNVFGSMIVLRASRTDGQADGRTDGRSRCGRTCGWTGGQADGENRRADGTVGRGTVGRAGFKNMDLLIWLEYRKRH